MAEGEDMTDGGAPRTGSGKLYLIREFDSTDMAREYYKFEDRPPQTGEYHKVIADVRVINMRVADRALQKAFKAASDDQKGMKEEWYMFKSITEAESKFREALKPYMIDPNSNMNE